jgi:hypothetical protein
MKRRWITMLYLSAFGLLPIQLAQAQVCLVSNSNLAGTYGFVASESGTIPATTGTTTTTGTSSSGYSNTEVGSLLSGVAAGNQFGLSGILILDGAGNVDAAASLTGGVTQIVGNYKVNFDCSVSMSVMDTFVTNSPTSLQLVGVVLGRGSEIDLTTVSNLNAQTATTSNTSSTGTTPSATTGEGFTVKLVPVLYRNGCSVATVGGLYGFVLNPDQTQQPASTVLPATVMGYLFFDGFGKIIAQPIYSNTPSTGTAYAALAFTGTYTINADCSGTMSISSSWAGTSTTTATSTIVASQTLTINFVVSPSTFSGQANTASAGPVLNLSFSDANESGWGYAVAE